LDGNGDLVVGNKPIGSVAGISNHLALDNLVGGLTTLVPNLTEAEISFLACQGNEHDLPAPNLAVGYFVNYGIVIGDTLVERATIITMERRVDYGTDVQVVMSQKVREVIGVFPELPETIYILGYSPI
jgi:hypothetical protein